MRKGIWGLIGTVSLCSLLMPLCPGDATAQTTRAVSMEKSLLGIRLLQTYSAVLKKYGQPHRIYSRDESVGLEHALDSRGAPTGGIRGIYDATGGGATMAGRGGGPAGGPMAAGISGPGGGMSMPPGMGGGGPGSGGSPFGGMSMPPGMAGRGGGPGSGGSPFGGMSMPPGMAGGGSNPYGGASGFSGGPGSGGPARGPMMAGAGGGGIPGLPGSTATGGSRNDIPTFGDSGGFSWVYHYPKKEIVHIFIFNKDQRVIAICQFGNRGGLRTSRGVGLGTPIRSVYSTYGWPNSSENQALGIFSMFYNEKYHVQFDTLKNRVVGIVVTLSEDMKYYRSGGAPQSGGANLAGGGLPGGPMAAGAAGAGGGGGKLGAVGGGGGGAAASAAF